MSDYKVGQNTTIGEHVIIEDDCHIGNNVLIEDFVVLKSGTSIEDNCIIRSGAKIGVPSFSFDAEGSSLVRRKEIGVTIIKSGTEIGYNAVIQRGVERDTEIGPTALINNLVNIGHDVVIGTDSIIGLNSSISGHSTLGEGVNVAPGVTIMNRVIVGSKAFIGIGSLVLHDVREREKVVGRPAVELETYKREKLLLNDLLGSESGGRVISTNKRRWSRFFSRALKTIREKYLTW